MENKGAAPVVVDLIYAQDLALAHYGAVRMNEYYVSQYVDYTPLTHARCGSVLAVRQNLSMGGRNPWVVIGSLRSAVSFATDALRACTASRPAPAKSPTVCRAPMLEGKRRQHEHSMAVLQDAQLRLEPSASAAYGFFGWFEEHHAAASSPADLAFVDRALALPETRNPPERRVENDGGSATLFSARPILKSLDLTDADVSELFGKKLRNVEREDGRTLSFFTGAARHVVLKAKELEVLRPHGHIIRSGDRLVPDEASLTSTTWMAGVVNSLVTQGHVNINRFLSTTRSYLGLQRSAGQRIFVELPDGYHLLDVPSAYEMTPNGCRWVYKHEGGVIEVRVWAPIDRHELILSVEIAAGPACRFLVSHHVALNGDDGADALPPQFVRDRDGVVIRPVGDGDVARRFPQGFFRIDAGRSTTFERVGGDEELFLDGQSRRQPFVTIVIAKTRKASLRITGHLVPGGNGGPAAKRPTAWPADRRKAERFWQGMIGPLTLHARRGDAARECHRLQEILPWLAHNAMIHYLAPRGLEQYSGGGWGTRDVCQGPVEMLLALGKWEPLRDLLLRVFKVQNTDGDWPQWFMFFERERGIRPTDSHGDIIFWPLLALAQYLIATDDVVAPRRGRPVLSSAGRRAGGAGDRSGRTSSAPCRRSPGASSRGRAWPRMATATGTTRCSRSTRRCASGCAVPGPSPCTTRRSTTLATALRRIGRAAAAETLESSPPYA